MKSNDLKKLQDFLETQTGNRPTAKELQELVQDIRKQDNKAYVYSDVVFYCSYKGEEFRVSLNDILAEERKEQMHKYILEIKKDPLFLKTEPFPVIQTWKTGNNAYNLKRIKGRKITGIYMDELGDIGVKWDTATGTIELGDIDFTLDE